MLQTLSHLQDVWTKNSLLWASCWTVGFSLWLSSLAMRVSIWLLMTPYLFCGTHGLATESSVYLSNSSYCFVIARIHTFRRKVTFVYVPKDGFILFYMDKSFKPELTWRCSPRLCLSNLRWTHNHISSKLIMAASICSLFEVLSPTHSLAIQKPWGLQIHRRTWVKRQMEFRVVKLNDV